MRGADLGIGPARATLRPFLAAYLLVLGLSVAMLPVVRVSGVADEWPRGLLTAGTGLVVMWLGLLPSRRSTALLHLVGLPQVVVGIGFLVSGLAVAGLTLVLVGVAVVCLPFLDRWPDPGQAPRGDVLTYLLLAMLCVQGGCIAFGLDGAAELVERAGLPPPVVGLALVGLGVGAAAGWWLGSRSAGVAMTIIGGVGLLGLVAIAAAGLGPALWLLSGATYLRVVAMLATPWRMRWTVAWKGLEVVLALALVTAGVVPLLIVVLVERLSGAVDDVALGEQQLRFAAAAFALAGVAIAGIIGGRLMARPMMRLRAQVAALPLGPPQTADGPQLSEFAEIGRAIDEASAALLRERRQKDQLIATLQQRNEQLAAATAAKDDFLGMVSHELKTPITAILGYSELLARPGYASTEILADVRDEAERLGAIVDNLLALARLDAGHPSEPEPVLLQPLVAHAVGRAAAHAPERRFRVDIPRSMIVEVASDQLEIVLRNLLSNALKYGDPAGEIVLAASQIDGMAVVSIVDGGPGIPTGQDEAVFQPFFRSPSVVATTPGMGIGLAVCRRVVEANGGRCWAEPVSDGGTVFKVSLPLAA